MTNVQQINLFNPDFVPRRDLATARYLAPATLVILMLTGAGAWAAHHMTRDLSDREQALTTELNAVRLRSEEMSARLQGRTADATLERQLTERRALLSARKQLAQWLRADGAGSAQGVSEYFRALARQSTEGIWLTGFALHADRGQLSIEGRVLKGEMLPDYLGRLGTESLLKGRTFATVAIDAPAAATPPESTQLGMAFKLESAIVSPRP